MRHTVGLHRAALTLRLPWRAKRGAQIHDGLRVARHAAGRIALGQKIGGPLQERLLIAAHRQIARKAQNARQDALDVAIQDRHALAPAKGRNGRGSRRADTGQTLQIFRVARKFPAPLRHHLLSAGMQVSGSGVITQA